MRCLLTFKNMCAYICGAWFFTRFETCFFIVAFLARARVCMCTRWKRCRDLLFRTLPHSTANGQEHHRGRREEVYYSWGTFFDCYIYSTGFQVPTWNFILWWHLLSLVSQFLWKTEIDFWVACNSCNSRDLLLFFVIYDRKWRAFGFWTVGLTKEAIWIHHFRFWEILMSTIFWHLIDS